MAKQLYLLRHAQSTDKQTGQRDTDRELTSIGIKESILIGTYLFKEKKNLDVIYSSTALRAQSTAQLLSDALKFDPDHIVYEEELYSASVRTFFEFICQMDNSYNQILCIGHNPTISYLGEYLCKAEIGDMPPGGLTIIQFDLDSWRVIDEGKGDLVDFITPASLEVQ